MFRKQLAQLNIQFEKTEEASRSSFLQTGWNKWPWSLNPKSPDACKESEAQKKS